MLGAQIKKFINLIDEEFLKPKKEEFYDIQKDFKKSSSIKLMNLFICAPNITYPLFLNILTCFCHAQELTLPDTPITNNRNFNLILFKFIFFF